MKSLHLWGLLLLCGSLSFSSRAQDTLPVRHFLPDKKLLFSRLSDSLPVSMVFLEKLFAGSGVGAIQIPGANAGFLQGNITGRYERSPHVSSISIRLPEFDQALLSISRIVAADLSIQYIGRIVNIRYGDVFILEHKEGQYYFSKNRQALFLVE